jgi:hypothetical protein
MSEGCMGKRYQISAISHQATRGPNTDFGGSTSAGFGHLIP